MYKYLSFPDEEIVSGMLCSTDLIQCDNRKSKWKIPKKQTRGLENARWREVTCERGFVPVFSALSEKRGSQLRLNTEATR